MFVCLVLAICWVYCSKKDSVSESGRVKKSCSIDSVTLHIKHKDDPVTQ